MTGPLASYKDLCIDAADASRMSLFWAAVLGLTDSSGEHRRVRHLTGPSEQHGVWINTVPEPRTVKQRVHLDVHTRSVAELEALGSTVLDRDSFPWTVLADPEGGEFCAFVRDEPPDYRLYELGVDCADPATIAGWWAGVLGGEVVTSEDGSSSVGRIPGVPFEAVVFAPVPEPKAVKNRIHWDVDTDDLAALVAGGARVLRTPDDRINWTVLADPEGNEFCAFTD